MILKDNSFVAIFLVVLGTIGSVGALLYFGVSIADQFRSTEEAWQVYNERLTRVSSHMSSLERSLGYGGFIHEFKNYVLRREPAYEARLRQRSSDALAGIERLEESLDSEEEKQLLRVIRETIQEYLGRLEQVKGDPEISPAMMDRMVRVDDGPALAALDRLQQIVEERSVKRDVQARAAFERSVDRLRLGSFVAVILLAGAGMVIYLLVSMARGNRRLTTAYARLDQFYEELPIALISVDEAGKILRMNNEAEALLGYELAEVRLRPVEMLIPGRLGAKHKAQRNAFIKDPRHRPMMGDGLTLLARRKDGKEIRVDIAISTVKTTTGVFFLVCLKDITATLRLTQELLTAREEAETARGEAIFASEAKSRFLASMSHEIRTPLNGVLSMLQLVDRSEIGPDSARKLAIATESGQYLLTLINQVLDFARIEAGGIVTSKERFSLPALMNSIQSMFTIRANLKGLDFHCDVSGADDHFLMGDYDHMRQVLFNLSGNAVKFTERGSVVISANSRITDDGKRCRIVFEVSDTGPGIAEEDSERIFEEFAQTEVGIRHGGGTGLGLNISKRIAEAIGAKLELASTSKKGTTFRFVVMAEVAEDQEILSDDGPASGIPPLRVLLVEDNDVNRMISQSMLDRDGHRVTEARDGMEAVEAVRRMPDAYDLVLMDIQMPQMDGVQATIAIRQIQPDDHALPIVGLTANAFHEQKLEYIAAGMQFVLIKPIDIDELRRVLARFSRGAGGAVTDLEPEFDRAILAQLRETMEPEKLAGIFQRAMDRADAILQDLRDPVQPSEKHAAAAHELSGMLATFGLVRLRMTASRIADAAKAGTDYRDDLNDLEAGLRRLRPNLQVELVSPSGV